MNDVIIIGGGPSGASAGRRAGKLGLKTLLLEKAKEMGIEVHTGEKALCCREMPDYIEVDTGQGTYRAKFAKIAEGAQGLIKTCVRPADNKEEYGICLVTEIPAEE